MAKIIEARVVQKAATLAEWQASTLPIYDGEQLFVKSDVDDEVIGFKLGSNGKTFDELPYPDYSVRGKVSPSSVWTGAQSGVYIPTQDGTYNGITVSLADGYQVLYWDGATLVKIVYDRIVDIINNLNSTSATAGLSANQGRVLNEAKEDKSNKAQLITPSTDQYPSNQAVIDYTNGLTLGFEKASNKAQSIDNSSTKYPSNAAVNSYAEAKSNKSGLVDSSTVKYPSNNAVQKYVQSTIGQIIGINFGGLISDSYVFPLSPAPTWWFALPGTYNIPTLGEVLLTESLNIISVNASKQWNYSGIPLDFTKDVLIYDTIEDLRNISLAEISLLSQGLIKSVNLLGYYEKNDSPEIRYFWDSNKTDTDDGGSIIKPNLISDSGRLIGVFFSTIDVRNFGITNTGNQLPKFLKVVNFANNRAGGADILCIDSMVLNNTGTSLQEKFQQMITLKTNTNITPLNLRAKILFEDHVVPLINMVGSQGSITKGIDFKFTGVRPTSFIPGGSQAYRDFYNINFQGFNNNYLSTVFCVLDSDNCIMENNTFESLDLIRTIENRDSNNNRGMVFLHYLGGKNGQQYSSNNIVRNVVAKDFQFGIFFNAQYKTTVSNINGDWRAYLPAAAEGHIVYTAGAGGLQNDGCIVEKITEGSNYHALDLGTLAIKSFKNGIVRNIVSHYPEGVLQSIDNVDNTLFEDIYWRGDGNHEPINPVINLPNTNGSRNNTFRNIKLDARNQCPAFIEWSQAAVDRIYNNTFNNIDIIHGAYSKKDTPSTGRLISNRGLNNVYTKTRFYPQDNVLSSTNGASRKNIFINTSGSLNTSFEAEIFGEFAVPGFLNVDGINVSSRVYINNTAVIQETVGIGSPEGALALHLGSIYKQIDTANLNTNFWIKTTANNLSSGWVRLLRSDEYFTEAITTVNNTENYSILQSAFTRSTVRTVYINAGSGNRNVLLPDVSVFQGYTLNIIRIDSSNNTVRITAPATYNINGQSSITLENQYDSAIIKSNGNEYVSIVNRRFNTGVLNQTSGSINIRNSPLFIYKNITNNESYTFNSIVDGKAISFSITNNSLSTVNISFPSGSKMFGGTLDILPGKTTIAKIFFILGVAYIEIVKEL